MSWGETCKINKNMKRALNEQIRDMKYHPIRVITSTGTYTPEKTGLYRVICVGAGGDGLRSCKGSGDSYYYYMTGGSAGGVAIKDIKLTAGTSYSVTVSNTASFGNEMSATAGVTGYYSYWGGSVVSPSGGIASGGDYNFNGQVGNVYNTYSSTYNSATAKWSDSTNGTSANGASVGVVISDVCRRYAFHNGTQGLWFGTSILEYGGGAPSSLDKSNSTHDTLTVNKGLPAAIIIIPLEMEE